MCYENINWLKEQDQFLKYLYTLGDDAYREFNKKITPSIDKMIGIRIPILKKIAKEISKANYKQFLEIDDKNIYEVILLKGLVIANIKDVNEYIYFFERFIGRIDNWAVCDSFIMNSKTIKRDEKYFFKRSKDLIKECDEFKNRVGFVIMLSHFVDDEHIDEIFKAILKFKNHAYYSDMALAWLLSVTYVKYTDKTKKFLITYDIDKKVLDMTIRKIKDSYRVSKEDKDWLLNIKKDIG